MVDEYGDRHLTHREIARLRGLKKERRKVKKLI